MECIEKQSKRLLSYGNYCQNRTNGYVKVAFQEKLLTLEVDFLKIIVVVGPNSDSPPYLAGSVLDCNLVEYI